MTIRVGLLFALLAGGCHRQTDPLPQATPDSAPAAASAASAAPADDAGNGPPAYPTDSGIAWQLTASPSTSFPMAQRGEFKLWIVARNDAPATQDTRRHSLEFQVNGRGSIMLDMAFGNGGRVRQWTALPPGQTLREARGGSTESTFGESLFPAPGDYHLTIQQKGRIVAALDVRVLPD